MATLTKKQKQVFDFITEYIQENGISPTIEEIRKIIGADSLGYLSIEGLLNTPVGSKCGFCTACFHGNYPMEVPAEGDKYSCGGCG